MKATTRKRAAPGKTTETGRTVSGSAPARRPTKKAHQRMPRAERQALVLGKAAEYFSEHGLNAQTRAIAEACGISQRLLYSLFASKAALIEEVYNRELTGVFKAIWFVNLRDRSVPLETRLTTFYVDYYEELLTRRWLRLFLYSSLEGMQTASAYSSTIVRHLVETIVKEAAHDAGRDLPADLDELAEIGWTLHGAVSHLAIRRRIYSIKNATPPEKVIAMHVRAFLAGIPTLLPELQPA